MAAVVQHVRQRIATLEGGKYPTSNLVKPYVGKMIDRLAPERTTTTTYRGKKEIIKEDVCYAIELSLLFIDYYFCCILGVQLSFHGPRVPFIIEEPIGVTYRRGASRAR